VIDRARVAAPARTEAQPAAVVRPGRRRRRIDPALAFMLAPALVLYGWFVLWPSLQSLRYSVTDWDGFSPTYRAVGLDNYERLLTADTIFRQAAGNSLKFMFVVVVVQTVLSLVLALALQRNTRSSVALRALYFFPTILSSVSVAFVWSFVYDPTLGLLNSGLNAVGLGTLQQPWLGDQRLAIFYLAIVQVWFHAGQMMVVFIAGLQQVPQELYDAADVDGANRWQRFRFVTFPMLRPTMVIVVAYTTIQSFKAFDLVFASTGGGPNHATEILSTLIYTSAFRGFAFGYAAAQSVLFMVLIAAVTFLQQRAVTWAAGGKA
jgi:raffinose/stachyose/melibiose transport system permease protein